MSIPNAITLQLGNLRRPVGARGRPVSSSCSRRPRPVSGSPSESGFRPAPGRVVGAELSGHVEGRRTDLDERVVYLDAAGG
jgi:hypothetical protein